MEFIDQGVPVALDIPFPVSLEPWATVKGLDLYRARMWFVAVLAKVGGDRAADAAPGVKAQLLAGDIRRGLASQDWDWYFTRQIEDMIAKGELIEVSETEILTGAIKELTATLAKPKRVVRDGKGRILGAEVVDG